MQRHTPFVGFQEHAAAALVLLFGTAGTIDDREGGADLDPEELWRHARKLLLQLATADGLARMPFNPLSASVEELVADWPTAQQAQLLAGRPCRRSWPQLWAIPRPEVGMTR